MKKHYKKIIVIVMIILAMVLLIPIPQRLKDGGTVEYNAVLYSISDVHRLRSASESGSEYSDGIIIRIFGKEVYNSVS